MNRLPSSSRSFTGVRLSDVHRSRTRQLPKGRRKSSGMSHCRTAFDSTFLRRIDVFLSAPVSHQQCGTDLAGSKGRVRWLGSLNYASSKERRFRGFFESFSWTPGERRQAGRLDSRPRKCGFRQFIADLSLMTGADDGRSTRDG